MRARELKELSSKPLGVHRVAELRQVLLSLSNGFDECVDDCLSSDGKPKE